MVRISGETTIRRLFLFVPIDDALFENGFADTVNGPMYLFNNIGFYVGPDYVALFCGDGSFDVYSKENGKQHFAHYSQVKKQMILQQRSSVSKTNMLHLK